jgi:hypothetical protein
LRPQQLGELASPPAIPRRRHEFCNTSRLRETAACAMWRIAVEDPRNLGDTFAQHERPQFIQPLLRLSARFGRSPVDLQIRRQERPNQPGPNSALMIRAIAAEWVPRSTAAITLFAFLPGSMVWCRLTARTWLGLMEASRLSLLTTSNRQERFSAIHGLLISPPRIGAYRAATTPVRADAMGTQRSNETNRDRMVISHGFTDAGRFDDTWAFDLQNEFMG